MLKYSKIGPPIELWYLNCLSKEAAREREGWEQLTYWCYGRGGASLAVGISVF